MFYKYNQLTQNLVSTSQDVSVGRVVTPQACLGTLRESPAVHYEYKPLIPTGPVREASSVVAGHGKYPVPNTPIYKNLMKLQTKFLENDGKLVWQKLPKDKPLYFLVLGMAVVGTLFSLQGLYTLASPPKNQ
jgi:hypothetical protein